MCASISATQPRSPRETGREGNTTGHHIVFAKPRDSASGRAGAGARAGRTLLTTSAPGVGVLFTPTRHAARSWWRFSGVMDRDSARAFNQEREPSGLPWHRVGARQALLSESIEPRGLGDYAAGFLHHFEPQLINERAKERAKQRGMRRAKDPPAEQHAGSWSAGAQHGPSPIFNRIIAQVRLMIGRSRTMPSAKRSGFRLFTEIMVRESDPSFKADQFGETLDLS